MTPLRVATLAGLPEREAEIVKALTGRSDAELVLRCVDRVELLASIRGGDIDALVAVGAPSWFDRQAAEEAVRAGIHIVGVTDDPVDADRLAALGASLVPSRAGISEILDRCTGSAGVPELPPLQPSVPRGRLVAVWGPKGAPGRTTVAIALAHELASAGEETMLLDGDPYGGDVTQIVGITEELPTVVWAARLAARQELDENRISKDLRRTGPEGPIVLPGLPRAELWAEISEFGWAQLLEVVRAVFDRGVIDTGFGLEGGDRSLSDGAGRDRMSREAIRASEHTVAVCRADPVGVKNFIWAFDTLTEITERDRILVVANQVRSGEEREVGDLLRRHIGKRPVAYLPFRPLQVHRAILSGDGALFAGDSSDLRPPIRSLAAALGGEVAPGGLLARMLRRS